VRRGVILAVGLLAALALTLAAGARADESYTDDRGDGRSGPDVTNLTVRSDAAGGLAFQMQTAAIPAPNHSVMLYIDVDGGGAEYWIWAGRTWDDGRGHFNVWNGSTYVERSEQTLRANGIGSQLTEYRFNRSAIANASSFRFFIRTASVDFGSSGWQTVNWDHAPNSGWFSYSTTTSTQCSNGRDDDGDGRVDMNDPGCASPNDNSEVNTPDPPTGKRLTITHFSPTPSHPQAGSRFTLAANVSRRGLTPGGGVAQACRASLDGRKLESSLHPEGPRPRCSWEIPATAAGKVLTAQMWLTQQGITGTRRYSARVAGALVTLRRVGRPELTPARPIAGKTFTYAIGVAVQRGTNLPHRINGGTVKCTAAIRGRPLEVVPLYSEIRPLSGARCMWKVPFGTSGENLVGSVTVLSEGARLVVPLRLRVS
jgi:hypothetical protein